MMYILKVVKTQHIRSLDYNIHTYDDVKYLYERLMFRLGVFTEVASIFPSLRRLVLNFPVFFDEIFIEINHFYNV